MYICIAKIPRSNKDEDTSESVLFVLKNALIYISNFPRYWSSIPTPSQLLTATIGFSYFVRSQLSKFSSHLLKRTRCGKGLQFSKDQSKKSDFSSAKQQTWTLHIKRGKLTLSHLDSGDFFSNCLIGIRCSLLSLKPHHLIPYLQNPHQLLKLPLRSQFKLNYIELLTENQIFTFVWPQSLIFVCRVVQNGPKGLPEYNNKGQ